MGPANAFFLTPQVFPFCCLRVFGDEKVLPWGVTVHVINALASLSHLASTPLSLSLSLCFCTCSPQKLLFVRERLPKRGPSLPSQSSLFCLLVLCFLFPDWVRLTGEGFVQGSLTSPISTKTQNMFSSHTHVIQMTTNVAEYNTSNITDTFLLAILKAIFQNVPFFQNSLHWALGFLEVHFGTGPCFSSLNTDQATSLPCGQNQNHNVSSPHGEAQTLLLNCQDPVS